MNIVLDLLSSSILSLHVSLCVYIKAYMIAMHLSNVHTFSHKWKLKMFSASDSFSGSQGLPADSAVPTKIAVFIREFWMVDNLGLKKYSMVILDSSDIQLSHSSKGKLHVMSC